MRAHDSRSRHRRCRLSRKTKNGLASWSMEVLWSNLMASCMHSSAIYPVEDKIGWQKRKITHVCCPLCCSQQNPRRHHPGLCPHRCAVSASADRFTQQERNAATVTQDEFPHCRPKRASSEIRKRDRNCLSLLFHSNCISRGQLAVKTFDCFLPPCEATHQRHCKINQGENKST